MSIYLLNIIQIAVIAVPDAYGLAAQVIQNILFEVEKKLPNVSDLWRDLVLYLIKNDKTLLEMPIMDPTNNGC